jgi:hypothetical protein
LGRAEASGSERGVEGAAVYFEGLGSNKNKTERVEGREKIKEKVLTF